MFINAWCCIRCSDSSSFPKSINTTPGWISLVDFPGTGFVPGLSSSCHTGIFSGADAPLFVLSAKEGKN
jgi:hypothetical protein